VPIEEEEEESLSILITSIFLHLLVLFFL